MESIKTEMRSAASAITFYHYLNHSRSKYDVPHAHKNYRSHLLKYKHIKERRERKNVLFTSASIISKHYSVISFPLASKCWYPPLTIT